MKVDVILGLQWGDEGKGKLVDVVCPTYPIIARFQGGPNAGHSLVIHGKKMVLNTIPSGIFRDGSTNVAGSGMVLNPVGLLREIKMLEANGVPVKDRLVLSRRAHLILPTHPLLDAAMEQAKGDEKIGSTLKGIGPAYSDKTARQGIRLGDLDNGRFDANFREQIARHTDELNRHGSDLSELNALCDEWKKSLDEIAAYQRADTEFFLNKALDRGEPILAEGAQGTLLDLEFGSYPFVTSSHTTVAGVCSGLGVAPQRVGKVMGIFKAYCTRVGSGPFPTELNNETGDFLRQTGHEFGATTGRPRRCGWIDLPALRYAIMLNGVTDLIMTKADVLSGLPEIGVCTHYRTANGRTPYFPSDLDGVEPVIKMIPGWNQSLTESTSEDALPAQLLQYIDLLEDELDRPIRIVSVGPDRRQTIHRR